MPICVIFNPTARGEKARHFRRALARLAAGCALRPTVGPGTAPALAVAAVAEGFDTLVAAGGDGTVNEVVNGLAAAPDGLERARLGILPLGTVNVFAKELALPEGLESAWAAIQRGCEQRVDLPEVEYGQPGQRQRRQFMQLAGAGLDSRAIERVNWEWKKRVGTLAYIAAGFQALAGRQPILHAEGAGHRATGELILVGNGAFYGGRLAMFPGASLEDGLLEVRVFPKANLAALARVGWTWLTDRPAPHPGECRFQAASVTLTSAESVPFQVDGDNAGHLPATFTLRRRVLRVIVPPRA